MGNTVIIACLVIVIAALVVFLFRQGHARGGSESTVTLQHVLATMQATQAASNSIHIELRGLAEKVAAVDQTQANVGHGLHTLQSSVQNELSQARISLADLQAQASSRAELEYRTAESVRRLEMVIAGTQSKGAAGENILDAVFAQLPPDWQVRDFRVGNKVVEFALRLPNNLILPIDSKWPATALLEQFVASDDVAEQQRLKEQIEATVLAKAKEVKKYLDPALTVNFGIAAVPDAIYGLCSGIQCACFESNVVLVAYSMFVPYLLLVFQTVLRTSQNLDMDKLDGYLHSAQASIEAAQAELEGRFAKSLTMLGNSRDTLSVQLGKINATLTSLQIGAPAAPERPLALVQAEIAG